MGTNSSAGDISVGEGVIGKRVIAYLIDIFILWMAGIVLWVLNIPTLGLLTPLLALLVVILPLAYHSLMISSSKAATIGQQALGLKVVSQDGKRIEILQALILTGLFYASIAFTSGLILIWCLFDNKQRCLHDILAGTLTIRTDEQL